jgi:hypothetical protein
MEKRSATGLLQEFVFGAQSFAKMVLLHARGGLSHPMFPPHHLQAGVANFPGPR